MKSIIFIVFIAFLLGSCSNTGTDTNRSHGNEPINPDSVVSDIATDNVKSPSTESLIKKSDVYFSYRKFSFISSGKYYVLGQKPDTSAMNGKPERVDCSYGVAAVRNTEKTQLPDSLKALIGKKVRVFSAEGKMQETEIIAIKYLVQYVPHFSQTQNWEGTESDGGFSADDIAKEIWSTGAKESLVIVGELGSVRDPELLWGQFADEITPNFYTTNENEELQKTVINQCLASPKYKEIQEEYKKQKTDASMPEQWSDYNSNVNFKTFTSKNNEIAGLWLFAGDVCSGEFNAELGSIWKMDNGKPSLLFESSAMRIPTQVFDLDNDNVPEILFSEPNGSTILLKKISNEWKFVCVMLIPFYDCLC
jgi:hypothetical protein